MRPTLHPRSVRTDLREVPADSRAEEGEATGKADDEIGVAVMELPDLPSGWHLKSLIEDNGLWKAYCYSDTEYCMAGGSNPRFAMLDALARIADGSVHTQLSGGKSRYETIDILEVLKIPERKMVRRI